MSLDAIIILAGGIDKQGNIPRQVELRLDKGIELFRQKRAERIIVSGKWSIYYDFRPPITEAEAMKRYLTAHKIPKSAILKEEESQSTIGNAYFVKTTIYQRNKWRSALVVTSDVHLERTRYIFETVFGSECRLEFAASPSGFSPLEHAREQEQHGKSFERAKKLLANCEPGKCDERVRDIISDKNTYAETKMVLPETFIKEGKFD